MTGELPLSVRLLCRLIPAGDRESILGDLLEDAAFSDLRGVRRQAWLAGECGAIAAGLSLTRLHGWLSPPPMREVLAGFVVDGRRALCVAAQPGPLVWRAVVLGASVAAMTAGVDVLLSTLLSASGLGR